MSNKQNIFALIFILMLSACRQAPVATFFTRDGLAPYYGDPQPAKVLIDDQTYNSEIGNTRWIKLTSNGTRYTEFGDTFAIITPIEPIVTTSNPSLTLKLPIPIEPTNLWYALFKVSEKELLSQESSFGAFRWNPDYEAQTYQKQTDLSLLPEQQLTLSLEPGIYVFEVHAGWGSNPPQTQLEADYGFLIRVQE